MVIPFIITIGKEDFFLVQGFKNSAEEVLDQMYLAKTTFIRHRLVLESFLDYKLFKFCVFFIINKRILFSSSLALDAELTFLKNRETNTLALGNSDEGLGAFTQQENV